MRHIEHDLCRIVFNDLAQQEEGSAVADSRGLLHIMRDDHDGILLFELGHQVLDLCRRDRVECARRLIHEQDIRLHGQRPGDTQSLVLAAGQAERGFFETVLDLVPKRRLS